LDAPLPWMPGAVAPFAPSLHDTGHSTKKNTKCIKESLSNNVLDAGYQLIA